MRDIHASKPKIFACAIAAIRAAPMAQAATITVNAVLDDSIDCALRAAIANANTDGTGGGNDQFLCYRTKETKGSDGFNGKAISPVTVADQFETAPASSTSSARMSCVCRRPRRCHTRRSRLGQTMSGAESLYGRGLGPCAFARAGPRPDRAPAH